MLTLKPVTYEPRSDGTVSLAIRLTLQRQVKYWQTGLVLLPRHINPDGSREKMNWIRRSFEAHERANRLIRDRLQRAGEVYDLVSPRLLLTSQSLRVLLEKLTAAGLIRPLGPDYPPLIWEQVQPFLSDTGVSTFTDFYARFMRAKGGKSTVEMHRVVFAQLHEFFGRWPADTPATTGQPLAPILFTDLTVDNMLDFKSWLQADARCGPSTIHNKYTWLKEVMNLAFRAGKLPPGGDPLLGWDTQKGKTERQRLTGDELKRLEDLLPSLSGTPYHVLQIFRYQFYAQGKRIGDALTIIPEALQDDRLVYRTSKAGKLRSIQLHPILKTIVLEYMALRERPDWPGGPYLFPFLTGDISHLSAAGQRVKKNKKTTLINPHLKALAVRAGIAKNLTTHVARHSFADNARTAKGPNGEKLFDVYDISKALGHSSIATTEIYLAAFDQVAVDNVNTMYYRHIPPETTLKQMVESGAATDGKDS